MESDQKYTLVGAFVLFLTAAVVVSIIWLSSGFSLEKTYKLYAVQMHEAVIGLSLNAPVEYNGVNVGNVDKIAISSINPQFVELVLEIKKDTPITMGTRARLDVRSLSGVAYIQLIDKGQDMRPLEMTAGDHYPVIPTIPSLLLRIDTALTQLDQSFRTLSQSINTLLDKDNLKTVKYTLKNLRTISDNLASNSRQFSQQTLPVTNQLLLNLNQLLIQFTKITAEIKDNPALFIRGKTPVPLGPGEK